MDEKQKAKLTEFTESENLKKQAKITRRATAQGVYNYAQYKVLFDNAPDAIFLADPQSGIIFEANRAAKKLLKKPLNRIIGMHQSDLHPPELKKEVGKIFKEHSRLQKAGGQRKFAESYILRNDGKWIPVEILAEVVKINEKPVLQGFFRDITQRKKTEEALKESEEKYRDVVERANDGIIIIQDGIVKFFNPKALEFSGYKRSEVVNTAFEKYIHPDERAKIFDRYRKRMAGEKVEPIYETVLKAKNGKDIFVEINADVIQFQGKISDLVLIRDITERKLSERALVESEDKYRNVVERANDGIAMIIDGKISYCNQSMLDITGYPMNKIIGKPFVNFLHPDEVDKVVKRYNQRLKGKKVPKIYESVIKRADGEDFFIEINSDIITYQGKRAILAIIRDITERKIAEEKFHKMNMQMQALVKAIPDVVYFKDEKGRNQIFNEAFARLVGLRDNEIIGKTDDQLLPQDLAEKCKRSDSAVRKKRKSLRFEEKMALPSGEIFFYETIKAPIFSENNQYGGLVGVSRDITERKRADNLLQSLNSTALAMQNAITHDEIFEITSKEFGKLGFNCLVFPLDESHTRIFTRYMSYTRRSIRDIERLLKMKENDYSIPIDEAGIYEKVIKNKRTVLIEDTLETIKHFLPDAAKPRASEIIKMLKIQKTIAAPLIAKNEVIGVFSVQSNSLLKSDIQAITAFAHQLAGAWYKATLLDDLRISLEELQQTQAQLIQAQKMEAIGNLAGGIAHDFNNLLTVIQGYSELLLNRFNKGDRSFRDVIQIEKAGKSAESLVRQLLAFSRKQILKPKVISLNNLIRDMEPMLERLIGEDIELSVILDPTLGNIKADPNQIEQVIFNLLANARDAMPNGGKLLIETQNFTVVSGRFSEDAGLSPGRYAMLSVSDNGSGMDATVENQIFEPFFTTKKKGKGTGLGLSTVYGIVKQSEGSITVSSTLGKGTTFEIYLPQFGEKLTTKNKKVVSADPTHGTETILVVEDEPEVRFLVCETLRSKGYFILDAPGGETALEVCEEYNQRIDLLLTDVVMPRMSGAELFEQLKKVFPDIKVLYMSGYTDYAIVHHGVLDENIAFIQKPFVPDTLGRKVRDVLNEGKPLNR